MKKRSGILLLGLALVLAVAVNGFMRGQAGLHQNQQDRAFAATITHQDMQEIFQTMFDTNFAWTGGPGPRPDHIVETKFINKTFKITDKNGKDIPILTQAEFDELHITPYLKITDIEYGKGRLEAPKQNTVSVHWAEQWASDGAHGYNTFIKENGRWKNLQGLSGS